MHRVLIVDDEPLARRRAREVVERTIGFQVAGECANGLEAVEALQCGGVDVVLLDVRMPGLGGFEVVAEIGAEVMPPTIFLTAFGEHAVRAFDVRATDYVQKPWARERLQEALRRASLELRSRSSRDSLGGLLALRAGPRAAVVEVGRIDWIEGAANYARVHADGNDYLTRETLASLESRLPTGRFLRIHRSSIIAVAAVREVGPRHGGELAVRLRDGTSLTCSRTYRASLRERLGSWRQVRP